MRHSVTTAIDIPATPDAVWAELIALEHHSEWNPFITSAKGDPTQGSRLDIRLAPPGGKAMRFRPTVTVCERARTFEWLGHLGVPGLFDGRHRFELHPIAGGTRLIQSEDFSGLLVRLARRSLDGPTRAGFEQMNAALRDRVLARCAPTT